MKSFAIAMFIALSFSSAPAEAAALDGGMQKRVRAATFEVAVPKAPEDAVKYERPPPYELLTFAERTDKFWSVGTAFAISPDTFVTAAHVLNGAVGGQGGPPVLRDAKGKTFPIERVLKYSAHQDFAVFTAGVRAPAALATRSVSQLDEPVFAVGNALGEGVVIRDGLLTSLTPEDQDGRWKWLRYSAATSPGNSGGPLLNAAGEVVGLVIGKSAGENLNYALPIEHVLDAPQIARADVRFPLRLPMLRDGIVAKLDLSLELPLTLDVLTQRLVAENLARYRAERDRLLREKAAELPPLGKSDKLLGSVDWAVCPLLLSQSKERVWEPGGSSRENYDVAGGGKVCARHAGGMGLFSIERGKTSDPAFHGSRRAAMDLLLQGMKFPRVFGDEAVAIVSLGAPVREAEHLDRYKRRWHVATFALPHLDQHIVTLMLPTPNGYAGLMSFASRGSLDLVTDQLAFTSDYFYVTYYGTLPQWQVFLAGPSRPPALDGVKLTRDAAGLHYRSTRIEFDVPPALLKLDDTSSVQLRMSYSRAGDALAWDVGAIFVSNEAKDERYLSITRQPMPGSDAPKELSERWADMLGARGEFGSGRGHNADFKELWRTGVVSGGYQPGATLDRNAKLLYSVVSHVEGAKMPREIDDMQELLLENVRVKER
jgi:hypothetical protein